MPGSGRRWRRSEFKPRARRATGLTRGGCFRKPIRSIWSVAFARKVPAIMASTASKTDGKKGWAGPRVTHAEAARRLAARRAELGEPDLPRNAGKDRTPSKRALLKAIGDAGGKW